MAAFEAAIHDWARFQVDGRVKPGHEDVWVVLNIG